MAADAAERTETSPLLLVRSRFPLLVLLPPLLERADASDRLRDRPLVSGVMVNLFLVLGWVVVGMKSEGVWAGCFSFLGGCLGGFAGYRARDRLTRLRIGVFPPK